LPMFPGVRRSSQPTFVVTVGPGKGRLMVDLKEAGIVTPCEPGASLVLCDSFKVTTSFLRR
jgi:predicted ATPase